MPADNSEEMRRLILSIGIDKVNLPAVVRDLAAELLAHRTALVECRDRALSFNDVDSGAEVQDFCDAIVHAAEEALHFGQQDKLQKADRLGSLMLLANIVSESIK